MSGGIRLYQARRAPLQSACVSGTTPFVMHATSAMGQNAKYSERADNFRFAPINGHHQARTPCRKSAMNRRQPTPSTGQSRATAPSSGKLGKVALDGTATNCVKVA